MYQAAPSFPDTFPHMFGKRKDIRCLIPCAIDQVSGHTSSFLSLPFQSVLVDKGGISDVCGKREDLRCLIPCAIDGAIDQVCVTLFMFFMACVSRECASFHGPEGACL